MFEADAKFACTLWAVMDVSPVLLYQLSLVDHTDAPRDVWRVRMRHLYHLLPPATLLEASLRVSPENGKPRLSAAVRFEEAVLQWLNKRGQWIV
jgi:hypothetical protein